MKKIKLIFTTLFFSLVFFIVAFFIYNSIEPKAYDFMTKLFVANSFNEKNKQAYGSDDVVLVVIDAQALERYRWPWKRELYCDLFEYFLKYANEKAIVYDSIITTLDSNYPESDRKFFNMINKFDNLVVGFMPVTAENQKINEDFKKKFKLNIDNKTSPIFYPYRGIMPFPKQYVDVVKNVGSVSISSGFINGNKMFWFKDEVYRNQQHFVNCSGDFYPSLAMSTYLLLNKDSKITLTDSKVILPDSNKEISHKKNIYQTFIPLKFYKLRQSLYSHKHYSAIDIMDSYNDIKNGKTPKIDPKEFEGKIIVVGANVPASVSLNDNKNTPISVNHPGVDIQATSIDNLIHNDFLTVLPQWFNFIITLFGMFLIYLYIRIFSLYKAIFATFATFIAYFILCAICYYHCIIINVLTPIVIVILTMIFSYIHKFVLETQSKEKVKTAMGKYMSEDVMKNVVQNIDNLGLGGKKATVTVLFSDIRGFTSMSEQMTAQQVSEILNEYFTEMEPIITQHNGIINKFIGDAIMAVFGEPIQDKDHAKNAVKTACKMLEKVKELQKKWAQEGKPKIDIGIGINTGEVFVGNIGSINRMEYTVIGDTVNLASRLESYNKTYKTKLLISTSTYDEVKNIVDVIKISNVQIRGKANKMDIYEVLKIIQ